MHAFIKSIDEKAWRSILQGWKLPTKTDVEGKTVPKDKADWAPEEDALSSQNSWALNAIFNDVDPSQFKFISTAKVDEN